MSDQIDPLDPELLDLVEAERAAPPPTPEQIAHLYARTAGTLGFGTVATAVVTKVTLGALILGAAIGSGITMGVMEPKVVEKVVVVPGPPPPPIVIEKEVEREPKQVVIAEKPKPKTDALKAEQALIERARSALAKRDGAGARVALEEHRAKFPNGKLSEERDALAVISLAVEGKRDEAKLEASAFEAKYPKSLFLGSVRAAVK